MPYFPAAIPGPAGAPGDSLQLFEHGSNASAIRPVTSAPVLWVGTVEPTGMQNGDIYVQIGAGTPAPTMPTGLVAHWSVEDLSLANGATVATWADRVSGRTLTATGAPTYDATEGFVDFDGVDDYMDATLSVAQPTTSIVVCRLPTTVTSHAILGSATLIHSISTSSAGAVQLNNGTSRSTTLTPVTGTVYALANVANGSTSLAYSGRTEIASGNAGTNARSTVRLGANTGATAFGRIDVKAVLVFDRALSSSEIGEALDAINYDLGTAF